MGPKKGGLSKAEQAAKQKKIEDKTFGLKNKNKSKAVQKQIKEITAQAEGEKKRAQRDKSGAPVKTAQELKAEKEAWKAEMAALFKPVQAKVPQQEVGAGVDPKSVLCQFFKQGLCTKGNKCKFSHNLEVERKSAKIDLYSDKREDGMEDWDQDKLESEVKKRENKEWKTDIICKYFLEAVETKKYGFFWECPNGGDKCIYRHKLPPGYVLKSQKEAMEKEEEENKISLEENIDELRKTVEAKTPITLETFTAWKKKRAEEKAAEDEKAEKEKGAKKKTVSGVMGQMSGRALFSFDPTMFQDDDEATDDKYEVLDDGEQVTELIVGATSIGYNVVQGSGTADGDGDADVDEAAAGIDEGLFLDDDVELPDEDDLG